MIAVVTCDLIKSRSYSMIDRQEVDVLIKQAFAETIETITEAKADKLSFNIIQGDEFQFVIENPVLAYKFVVFYRLILSFTTLKPIFRAGIGFGDIAVENKDSYKMDGSAFHRSREAFQKFNKTKFKYKKTFINSNIQKLDDQLEIITLYNDYIESKWTDKQKEAIFWINQSETLKEASQKINIKFQNVDKRLKSAAWDIFKYGEKYLQTIVRLSSAPL